MKNFQLNYFCCTYIIRTHTHAHTYAAHWLLLHKLLRNEYDYTQKTIYLLCHGICLLLVLRCSLVRLPHLRHKLIHRPTQKPGGDAHNMRGEGAKKRERGVRVNMMNSERGTN